MDLTDDNHQSQQQQQQQQQREEETPQFVDVTNYDDQQTHALPLLLSEECLEAHPLLVRALQTRDIQGTCFTCIDCPLQSPVSLLLDEVTCLCLVDATPLMMSPQESVQRELKTMVRGLTQVAFKYRVVWLVLMVSSAPGQSPSEVNSLLLRICQSVSRFPNQIVLRQCCISSQHDGEASLHRLVRSIAQQVTREQTAEQRSFLSLLDPNALHVVKADGSPLTPSERSVFSAHCEYLQLFPSVNFYLAAALLSTWTLRELMINLRAYTRQKQTHRVFANALLQILRQRGVVFQEDHHEVLLGALEQFFVLLTVHAGLQIGG